MTFSSLLRAFRFSSTPAYAGPRVRIAVIGAGRMGQFHLKHLSRIAKANVVGVVDANLAKAQAFARTYHVQAFASAEELHGKIDAAIIATPTTTHGEVGETLLSQGIHCLIEKPLASTLAQAEQLIKSAREHQLILQVGHIERFNPAVMEAVNYIRAPQFIEVNRLGPYDPRVADVGVIMDLMIHDLDIVLFLVGESVTRVEAFGAKVLSNHEDIAKVRLHFANGCIADLSASRVSVQKYRRIRIFQKDAYLSLDYAASQLKIFRKKSAVVRSLLDIERLSPKLKKEDPLASELYHFLDCILEKREPVVTGQHGYDAIALAQQVLANLEIHA